MREIPLSGCGGGHVALVDDEDYDRVMLRGPYVGRWFATDLGTDNVYVGRQIRRADGTYRVQLLHKFLTEHPQTDHKDHNGLNNQRSNLRAATRSQNNQNSKGHVNRRSKYKGLTYHRTTQKWRAKIKMNGHSFSLGLYTEESDAAIAYDRAACELFGEFAWPNSVMFPELRGITL